MFVGSVAPFTQPTRKWIEVATTRRGVLLQNGPLVFIRATGLVQNALGHIELADVVQQRGPRELVHLGLRESELFADHQRIGAHALAVAAGEPVMSGQDRNQVKQIHAAVESAGSTVLLRRLVEIPSQLFRRCRTHCDREPTWGCVGECERDGQQTCERHKPAHESIGGDHRQGRHNCNCQPPEDRVDRQLVGRKPVG